MIQLATAHLAQGNNGTAVGCPPPEAPGRGISAARNAAAVVGVGLLRDLAKEAHAASALASQFTPQGPGLRCSLAFICSISVKYICLLICI
jgi:hypothetical protein